MKKAMLPAVLALAGIILLILYSFNFGSDNLKIKINGASYIMPSAYKVYANPEALNGEYYFFKMLLTNGGSNSLQEVKISYRIPNYIDWTELQSVPSIFPGQNVVVRCYPHFKNDIVNKMTQSQETGEIKIEYNSGKVKTESFGFTMMGRNQFVYTDIPPEEVTSYPDMMHNTQLLPCLVTPEDPIIKYYTAQVQEKLMHGEAASVSNKPEDAVKFLEGLYAATYLSHMVYSGTEGIPQKLGDLNSEVQSARLPREVVTGNTGLCIELSLLYASVLKSAGLHAVIFLIPGHAYPGIEVNGQYYAIESTGINGEGLGGRMSPDDALKRGMKNLQDFIQAARAGDTRYMLIDVNDLESKGVIPMELADNDFLRKKVDDLTASFSGAGAKETAAENTVHETGGTGTTGGGNTGRKSSAMASYNGVISFSYPAGWKRMDYPLPQASTMLSYLYGGDQSAICVFNVPGAASADQALYTIKMQLAPLGQYLQYQKVNQDGDYFIYQGVTVTANGVRMRWKAVFRTSDNGYSGITLGSFNYDAYESLFNSIISSTR